MSQQISIVPDLPVVDAYSGARASVWFRDRSTSAAITPSTVRYRVDCLSNEQNVINWTSVTPASSATIEVPGTLNGIIDEENDYETRQLLVEIDAGLSTQTVKAATWKVQNNRIYEPMTNFNEALQVEPYYPITAEEIAAVVTPVIYSYPPGDVRRYGFTAVAGVYTVAIPTDISTLQIALDLLFVRPAYGEIIELKFDSAHQPSTSVLIQHGDYAHFRITSVDAEVTLSSSWTPDSYFMRGVNCRMPQWGILLDCNGEDTGGSGTVGSGALCVEEGSTLNFYGTGKGVKNAGGTSSNLFVYRNGEVTADRPVFTGAGQHNVWVTHLSRAYLERGDFRGAGDANVYVSRASTLYANGSDFSDSGAEGLLVRRSYVVVEPFGGTNTVFDNNGGTHAIAAEQNSTVCANARLPDVVVISNAAVHGISSTEQSIVNFRQNTFGAVTNDCMRATDGGVIYAEDVVIPSSVVVGGRGIYCDSAEVWAKTIDIQGVGGVGIYAENGGRVYAVDAVVTGSGGAADVQVADGGEIVITDGTVGTYGNTPNIRFGQNGTIVNAYLPETATGTFTLDGGNPSTIIDSTAGAVTGTLGNGLYAGFMKTIRMSNSSNSSTVSVTNHILANPTVYTFNSTTDLLILVWMGTRWVTVYSNGV